MSRLALRTAILALICVPIAFPQSTRISDSCDLAVLGATESGGFLAFDSELRVALTSQNVAVLALLVRYPLRINGTRGSIYLHDAPSLQARFQEIFPQAVRDSVLKQPFREAWCNYSGVMYGDGTVWVDFSAKRYVISAINLPRERRPEGRRTTPEIEFICETANHRIVVEALPDETIRYRAWDKPRTLADKPDLELRGGNKRVEGTGPCAHAIWTFMNGAYKYVVQNPGCSTNRDTRDSLEVFFNGKSQEAQKCF